MYTKKQHPPRPQKTSGFFSRFAGEHALVTTIYLKKKRKKDPSGCLYIRCTFGGLRSERSTGVSLASGDWNKEAQSIKDNPNLTYRIWTARDQYEKEITDGLNYAEELTGMEPSLKLAAKMVKGMHFVAETILQLYDHEIARMKEKKGEGFSKSNIQKHNISRTHLAEFIWKYYGKKDLMLREISKKLIEDFIDFLRTEKNCNHNTSIKHVAIFKKMHRVALDNRWTNANPFAGIKLGLKPVKFEFLTQEELDSISVKTFATARLTLVRDYFVFCCYTGLAYIDLMSLQRGNIKDYLSKTWINIHRTKTNVEASIPLMAPARMILEKYQPEWRKLPENARLFKKISNQKLNSYLKEVADISGVEKPVHFHMARHVFATTVTLANNVPIESVSKMLGHSRITMTIKHYARVIDQKVSKDMELLSTQLDDKFNGRKI